LKRRKLFPPPQVFFRMVAEERGGEKKPQPITPFVYRRYAIADDRDLRVAVERLDAVAAS
jgi:hypothetical protein